MNALLKGLDYIVQAIGKGSLVFAQFIGLMFMCAFGLVYFAAIYAVAAVLFLAPLIILVILLG